MSKENSTQKGNSFENKIFNVIQELIHNDDFFVSKKKSRIFSKKGYYSERRKDNIIVDISIETTLENADKYSFLTIIECKNYGKKGVPVDDIEEFDSKLNQIGEHNTKGIIVTNSHFQRGAISLAISKKIGLIKINEKDEVDWVNYRKDKKQSDSLNSVESYLSSENYYNNNFLGLYNNKNFDNLPNFLIETQVLDKYENKPKYIILPYRTEEGIVKIIDDLKLHNFSLNGKLDTDQICHFFKTNFDLSFNFENDLGYIKSHKILGKLTVNPLEISVSNELREDNHRWRFTLAHELGHFILHFDVLKRYLDENIDNEQTLNINTDYLYSYYNKRLEIQANLFASRLLIPQEVLIPLVKDYFKRERIHKSHLYLDHQYCNIELTYRLLNEMQACFEVSKEAAKIRLITQDLLVDATDTSINIKEIIQRM